jgi:hypothetical protein
MDDSSFAERLERVVQYRLAQVRGLVLCGDYGSAFEVLRFGLARDLAAWGSELKSDEVITVLPALLDRWCSEHVAFLSKAVPAMPATWANEKSKAGPAGAAIIDAGHQLLAEAGYLATTNVTAINTAIASLAVPEPPGRKFQRVLILLMDAPPLVELVSRDLAAKGNGHGT